MTPYSYRNDPAVPSFPDDKAIIVFDGYCVMCSRFMRFVMRWDRQNRFRLLPAQSPLGDTLFQHYGLQTQDYDSLLLIKDGRLHLKWDASIAIIEGLGWPWRLVGLGRILPTCLANRIYDVIATNRFRWFGRREVCMIPTAEDRTRFLSLNESE